MRFPRDISTSFQPIVGLVVGNLVALILLGLGYWLFVIQIHVEGAAAGFLVEMLAVVLLGGCVTGFHQERLIHKTTLYLVFLSPGVFPSLIFLLCFGIFFEFSNFGFFATFLLLILTLSPIGMVSGYGMGKAFHAFRRHRS